MRSTTGMREELEESRKWKGWRKMEAKSD